MNSRSEHKSRQGETGDARKRILDAAFSLFTARGYAQVSTLDIATNAKVSKRELYALVGKKQDMLRACITERANKLRLSVDLPVPHDRKSLSSVLVNYGAQLLREVTNPKVISVFRLAVAEAERNPEIAHMLDSIGRAQSRATCGELMAQAQAAGIISGDRNEMVERFLALLWGDLMIGLLMRVTSRPQLRELESRARNATVVFLQLYPTPNNN